MTNRANRSFTSLPSPPRNIVEGDTATLLQYIKDLHRDLENIISLLSRPSTDGGTP